MRDRRRIVAAHGFWKGGRPRRPLAGLAAGVLLFAVGAPAAAQQAGEPADATGNSGLRTGADLDLSATLRSVDDQPLVEPFALDPDQRPGEPSVQLAPDAAPSPDDTDSDEPDDEDAVPPSRPKIDLFAEPPAGRTRQENSAAGASEPAAAFPDPLASSADRRTADGRQGRLRRSGSAAERPQADGAAALGYPLVDGETGILDRDGLSLASEPVRSSRTQALAGQPALRIAPLRAARLATVDDPFAPLGLRLGSFLLYAAVDQSAGYSTNLDRAANGAGGAFSDTTLTTSLVSDWSRHQADLNVIANYRRNFGGETPSDPDVAADGRLRIDVDRLTTANLRGGFIYRKEDDTDLDATPEIDAEGAKPDILNYSLGADMERRFGDALARGSVSAVRETKSGGSLPNALDENFNTYTAAVRAGYEISPAFAPFVEASLGRRVFDEGRGSLGLERNSVIEALRGGVTFDLGEKLNGEAAVGYARNVPDADEIATAASPTFDAKLNWSPRRGTDLSLTAATTFDPDATGVTTSTLYQLGLAARHRATARLNFDATLLAGYRDSDLVTETQRTWGASVGFTYWINRSLAFIGLATHDDIDRLHAPGDYTVNTVKLGVRLQR